MKHIKQMSRRFLLVAGLTATGASQAGGIPVIDIANLAEAIQQVASWGQQYSQMTSQINQLQAAYDNLNGVRGMGALVNNPASRTYLPADYANVLNGVGNWSAIQSAAKKFDIGSTTLAPTSDAYIAFQQADKQAAINRAAADMGYSSANARFSNIQTLLDKVDHAPDAKDTADLQARIQAEQAMVQNEANKLNAMALAAQAQRDLQAQQAMQIGMKASKGDMPTGY